MMPNDPSFEDTRAASIFSSVPRNPLASQSRQAMPPPDEARSTDPFRPVSEGSTFISRPCLPIPHYSAAEPGAILQQFPPPLPPAAETTIEWAHPSMDFTGSTPRQDNNVVELAPFSSWQPGTIEDLDWGAALREITLGDPSMNEFASFEWGLLAAADREDDPTTASVSN
ncbi:hypothetical protein PCG10_009935 [Penicillium crustosum]|uniref:Uncharacterized protein n=1 Tax=Penicillium crustosum TaxID=36656 RepID=A0A9P5GG94_PENCR|nr:hypothetical protein PCG10_009935 [Penicillium crustosum]